MGDAEAPNPASTVDSEVTYQANIATVHVKSEDDVADVKPGSSPGTARKQKNGILKKSTIWNPAGTALTVPAPPSHIDDAIAFVNADKSDAINNNNKEALYEGLTAPEPADEVVANGGVSDAEATDTDGAHKKVSWSAETVVYTSRVDGGQRIDQNPMNGRPPGVTDNRPRDRRQQSSPLDLAGRSEKTTQKCCVIIAVKLLIIAIVGIVVLGIMYALRFSGSKTEKDIDTLRRTLQLEAPESLDLFTGAWHTSNAEPMLYLVADQDIMPWQRPTTDVNFMWHRGAPLIVYSIDEQGVLRSEILGDPLVNSAAVYTVSLPPAQWHAARLFDKDSYAVFSVLAAGDTYNWTQANSFKLQRQYPTLVSRINAYARRT